MRWWPAVLLLAGCAVSGPRPGGEILKVFHYPAIAADLFVVVAKQEFVNHACRITRGDKYRAIIHNDTGGEIAEDTNILGCYAPWTNTVYVSGWHPNVVYHELCHAAGLTRKECSEIEWED